MFLFCRLTTSSPATACVLETAMWKTDLPPRLRCFDCNRAPVTSALGCSDSYFDRYAVQPWQVGTSNNIGLMNSVQQTSCRFWISLLKSVRSLVIWSWRALSLDPRSAPIPPATVEAQERYGGNQEDQASNYSPGRFRQREGDSKERYTRS